MHQRVARLLLRGQCKSACILAGAAAARPAGLMPPSPLCRSALSLCTRAWARRPGVQVVLTIHGCTAHEVTRLPHFDVCPGGSAAAWQSGRARLGNCPAIGALSACRTVPSCQPSAPLAVTRLAYATHALHCCTQAAVSRSAGARPRPLFMSKDHPPQTSIARHATPYLCFHAQRRACATSPHRRRR